MPLIETIREKLTTCASENRLRQLRSITPVSGSEILLDRDRLISFASNDYLGLSQHPTLKERASEYIDRYGVGAPSSRLLCGNIEPYARIESKLARLKGTETALIFSSGYQANTTVLSTLAAVSQLLACDRLSHNSLLEGAQRSNKWLRYNHNDLDNLRVKLNSSTTADGATVWIVTESVFSMDGDQADIHGLIDTARTYGANLFVDEAHATGVFGTNGMGMTAGVPGIEISMGTFGKGCGSFGAYIACSNMLRQFLINYCPGLIYSTALPPPVLGAIDAALDLIPSLDQARAKLLSMAAFVRGECLSVGFAVGNSNSQIIPIVVGEEEKALALSEHLRQQGLFAPAIRPPTVPEGSCRVRLSLSTNHSEDNISQLLDALRSWHAR